MRILVTGASGFIGRHVIQAFAKMGGNYDLVAQARDLKEPMLNALPSGQVKWLSADFSQSRTNWYEFFGRPDKVIHLAWGELNDFNSVRHLSVEFPNHQSFLSQMLESGLSDITITGTCLEYGKKEGALAEDSDCEPTTSYGKAKLRLYKDIHAIQRNKTFDLKWCRIFYLYGEGQSPRSLIPLLDKAIDENQEVFNMSEGDQSRDYLPVEAVAKLIVKAALHNGSIGALNCCSGEPTTVYQLVQQHAQKRHSDIVFNRGYYPYPDYEGMHFWGDKSKLDRLGFQP